MTSNNWKRDHASSSPRRQQQHFRLIVILFFALLQVVISSLDEVGECPAGTYPGTDGQCSTSRSDNSRTIVDGDSDVLDSDEMVEDEYDDDNFDDDDSDDGINEYGDYDSDIYDDDDDDNDDDDEINGDDDDCRDIHEDCEMWASEKECDNNSDYMLVKCKKSCGECVGSNPATRYGVAQRCSSPSCHDVISMMETYMRTEAEADPAFRRKMLPNCKNRDVDCAAWASEGECDANPSFMQFHCAPVCATCIILDFNHRCPLDPDAKNALEPGDLNRMFERIVDGVPLGDGKDEEGGVEEQWDAMVHSRPSHPPDVNPDEADYILGPWVITIDNFINDAQCERLIQLGATLGYERSKDVGGLDFDGTQKSVQSTTRTSYNSWCVDECYDDPMTQAVLMKISNLTGIPDDNSENLQLLKYATGQFYRQHHDYIDEDKERPIGPRILTAYLYLNDVEAGGGTRFPKLKHRTGHKDGKKGLTVMPKKGRLLLWPSVRNDEPSEVDDRTDHEAMTVKKGEKYGANGWIHLRDVKTPRENNCL